MKFRITNINASDPDEYVVTFDVGEDDNTFIKTNETAQLIKANTGGRQSMVNQVSELAYYIWEVEHIGEVLGTVYPYDGVTYPTV